MAVGLQNRPLAVNGFSFGVAYDTTLLTLIADRPQNGEALDAVAATCADAIDLQFVSVREIDGEGTTVAVLLNPQMCSAVAELPPSDSDQELFILTYAVGTPPEGQVDMQLSMSGDLGDPAVPILLDTLGTTFQPTEPTFQNTATLTFEIGNPDSAPFIRGDVNQDGAYTVRDVLIVLNFLFGGGTSPAADAGRDVWENCRVAYNVDGSLVEGEEAGIDISDAVYLIEFVFGAGASPPTPSAVCGLSENPSSPELFCSSYPLCAGSTGSP